MSVSVHDKKKNTVRENGHKGRAVSIFFFFLFFFMQEWKTKQKKKGIMTGFVAFFQIFRLAEETER